MSSRHLWCLLTLAAAARVHAQPTMAAASAAGLPVAGISCDQMEGNRIHTHQHLLILDRGKPVAVPADVGRPSARECLYWLHTHTPDGIIHVEAPQDRAFTLGEFFRIWGQPLSRTAAASASAPHGATLRVWVDGVPYSGDPTKIVLARHTDVVIEAGPPYSTPPRFTTWGTL